MRTFLMSVLVTALLGSSSAIAQERHVVDPAAMNRALALQAAVDSQNRDAVLGVLRQAETRQLADRLGLNLTQAENAVATLSGAELAQLADSARAADQQLAGGADRIVISVTTLLLIIIVVLLIAR